MSRSDTFGRKFAVASTPLTRYAPDGVIPPHGETRDEVFVLALALVFNDLKGLLMFREAYAEPAPPDGELSAAAGEWNGVMIHAQRMLIGLLHELFELIREFKAEAVSEDMRNTFHTAAKSTRRNWEDLVAIALGQAPLRDANFSRVLLQVRNNAVFHYHQPKRLVAGYRHHFFSAPTGPENEFAFAAIGRNMETSRFHFADAAVQGALTIMAEPMGVKAFTKRLVQVVDAVNQALVHIIRTRLKHSRA